MNNCQFCGAEAFPTVLEGYTTWKCNSYATDLRDKDDGPVVQSVSCRIRELQQHKDRIKELEDIVMNPREGTISFDEMMDILSK